MSLTVDKFQGDQCNKNGKNYCYNKRVAVSYDIHYAIYLGVQEIMGTFSTESQGTGLDRWHYAIGHVFLPNEPNRYWSDSRSSVANSAWKNYATETAYRCTPGQIGTMDFRSVGPGSTNAQYGQWKDIVDVMHAVGTPGSQGNGIVSYTFMGKNISGGVNRAIVPALDKVQADLKASGVKYDIKDIEGFGWRANVNAGGKISPHAFGVAIDINPFDLGNDNCKPRKNNCQHRDPSPSCCKNDIPKAFSDAFEKNGFFWGAKFYNISDTMHFQYGGNYDTSRIDWNGGKIIVH